MAKSFAVVLLLGAGLFALVAPAHALPKQGGGSGSRCQCICLSGSLLSTQSLKSNGFSCAAYDNATCNILDPATGGVRSGTLVGCGSSNKAIGPTILISPIFGPIELSPN